MSTTFAVPAALQEFLGHRQTKVEAFSVLALGVLLTVIYAALFLGFIGHANSYDVITGMRFQWQDDGSATAFLIQF